MFKLLLSFSALAVSGNISCGCRGGRDLAGLGCLCGPGLSPDPRDLFGRRGDPLGALPRPDPREVHGVNLLESAALAFHDKEVDQQHTDQVAACEHIAVQEVDVASDEGREECDQEVPEPVAGRAKGHALGPISSGEKFSYYGPDLEGYVSVLLQWLR